MVLNHPPLHKARLLWAALGIGLVFSVANLLLHDTLFHRKGQPTAAPGTRAADATAPAGQAPSREVTLSEGKWKSAGISLSAATVAPLVSEFGVVGRIEANTDRRVEIRPRTSGVVRDVFARLGQKVRKGEPLTILDSAEIGTARLNLKGRQLELATARNELNWKRQVAENVAQLIPALLKGTAASVIEKEYAERPLGSDRALLMQAYTEYEIASHEAEKTGSLHRDKIVGEHPAFLAVHTREGARAKLEGTLEQVRFDAAHEQRLAEQKVKLAEAAVVDAAQRLRILGVAEDSAALLAHAGDVAANPPSANDDVTAYTITAPFDGTIVSKSVVASQKTEVNDVLFTLADLSTVWVMADVPESDLSKLPSVRGALIRLSSAAYPDRTFQAHLLSVGSAVDPTTRAVPIQAETENPDDMLKLGMFVRILFDASTQETALTVPSGAVVEIEGELGVFVPSGSGGRTFTFHPVRTGAEAGDRRVIVAGLAPGDRVVAQGAFLLKSELILLNEADEE